MSAAAAALLWLALGQALPYERLHASSGAGDTTVHCLWWMPGEVALVQSSLGDPAIPGTASLDAISASIGTWRTASTSCGSLDLVEAPHTSDRTIGYVEDGGTNLILYRQNGSCRDVAPAGDACWKDGEGDPYVCANKFDCWPHGAGAIAITTNTFDVRNGRLYDSDIELNAAGFHFTAADGPRCVPPNYSNCVYYDVQNTITHEVGHVVGLEHSPDPASTMYAFAPAGETSKRTLDPGSEQFVCDVYPKGSWARDCIVEQVEPRLPSSSGCAAAQAAPVLGALAALLALRRRRR